MPAARAQLNAPWFESPFFERELAQAALPPEMHARVASFARDGFLVLDTEIEDFGSLAPEIETALAAEYELGGNRVQDAWSYVPAVRRLATAPAITATLEALYRRRPVPFQTLNFRRGTQQETHSDLLHFNSLPPRYMAGVWIALEDVGPSSGPLHYYPGSHRLPVYELHDLELPASSLANRDEQYASYGNFVRELLAASGLEKQTLSLRAGQALIWAANLLHGGEPIADPESTRRSQVTHYYFEGCRYYTPLYSDPPLGRYSWRELTDIATGQVVPHVYAGREVRLPVRTRVRYAAERRMRRSSRGRETIRRIRSALRRGG